MKRDAIFSIAYSATTRGSLLAVNFVALKVLNADDFSIFAYASVLVSSVAAFAALGVGMSCNAVAARDHRHNPDRVSAFYSFAFPLNTALTILAAAMLVLPASGVAFQNRLFEMFAFVAALSLLTLWAGAAEGILFGLNRQASLLKYGIAAMTLSIVATSLMGQTLGLIGALAGLATHRLVVFLFVTRSIRNTTNIRIDIIKMRSHWPSICKTLTQVSVPLAIAGAMAGPLAGFLIGISYRNHTSSYMAGVTFGYQCYVSLIFLPNAFSNFLVSKSSSIDEDPKGVTSRVLPWMAGYALIAFATMIAMPGIVRLLNDQVEFGYDMAVPFGLSAALYSIISLFNTLWIARRRAIFVVIGQAGYAVGLFLAVMPGSEISISFAILIGTASQLLISIAIILASYPNERGRNS